MALQHLAPLGRLSGVCVLQNSFFYSYCCLTLIIFDARAENVFFLIVQTALGSKSKHALTANRKPAVRGSP